jgi:hypothetical protein
LLAGVLTFQGLLMLTAMLATSRGGPFLADYKLDSGAATTAGEVEAIDAFGTDRARVRVRFRFRTGAGSFQGESFATAPIALRRGGACTVEYWQDDPAISRVQGTEARQFEPELSLLTQLLLIPGGLALVFWVRGVLRIRVMLRDGTAVAAQVIENRLSKYVNPRQVRLRYRFQDDRGGEYIRSHWVRAGSEFGKWLTTEQPRFVDVLYDPVSPTLSRAVFHGDFAQLAAPPAAPDAPSTAPGAVPPAGQRSQP